MIRAPLVDDDRDYLAAETEALRELGGFDVSPAFDLAEAIRMARSGTFGILVTDKNIGGHRGLVPLLNYMQQERPETPVLINSAEPDVGVRQALYCHEFHHKGVEPPNALIKKLIACSDVLYHHTPCGIARASIIHVSVINR